MANMFVIELNIEKGEGFWYSLKECYGLSIG